MSNHQRYVSVYNQIPKLPDGTVDAERGHAYLIERCEHSYRTRAAVRRIAIGLGMAGQLAAQHGAATPANYEVLSTFIIDKMLQGVQLDALSHPQPEPTTDSDERNRLMRFCVDLEQELALQNIRTQEWYVSATVAELSDYKDYLVRLQNTPAEPVPVPEPAPVSEVLVQPQETAPVSVPQPPSATVNTDSDAAYTSPTGWVVPLEYRNKPAVVTQLINISTMSRENIEQINVKTLRALLNKNGMGLPGPDGQPIKNKKKAGYMEALLAFMYPTGHPTICPERIGATDWAAQYWGGVEVNGQMHIGAAINNPTPVTEPIPAPVTPLIEEASVQPIQMPPQPVDTSIPEPPPVPGYEAPLATMPLDHPLTPTTDLTPPNTELFAMLSDIQQSLARIEQRLSLLEAQQDDMDMVLADVGQHFNSAVTGAQRCKTLLQQNMPGQS